MEKEIDIQTILRDRMVFICNSICHKLGEDKTRWTVLLDENDDFPALCGYEINYYDNENVISFQLNVRKSTVKGKFIIILTYANNGEKTEFTCSLKYIAGEYVAMHEAIKAAV